MKYTINGSRVRFCFRKRKGPQQGGPV